MKALIFNLKFRLCIQGLFIYTWLVNLSETDSFLSVYILCAVLGALCLADNHLREPEHSIKPHWTIYLLAVLFGTATVLANYPLFTPVFALENLFNIGCSFLGGTFIAYHLLLCAIRRLPLKPVTEERKASVPLFFVFFFIIAAVFLLYMLTTGYPVYLAHDSIVSMNQISSGVYMNDHPYWYTRFIELCLNLGYLLSSDINVATAAYSTVQILILSACFAYSLVTLYQANIPWWCLGITLGIYALLPYNLTYSITMWKDTLFGGFSLAVIASVYRIVHEIGNTKWLNYLLLFLTGVGFCLIRHNGLPLFIVLSIAIALSFGKKYWKLILICIVVLVLCWFMTGPMLSALEVEDSSIVEVLAIPFQQIARVIAQDLPIQAEDAEFLTKIFQFDKVRELYTPYIVDPIKFDSVQPGGVEFLKEHMGQFLSTWFRLGLDHPGTYLEAWVEQTKGYWNGGYYYWIYHRGTYPELTGVGGFEMNNLGKQLFDALFRLTEKPVIFQPLYSIGLQAWAILSCAYVCIIQKRKEWILSIPWIALCIGLCFISPVYAEFRYAYPLFTTCPMILLTTLFPAKRIM